ncbi:MAG TPA: hypothetical protein VHZ50_01725 [Puia sp.]|jgi:hypothetical protein|nr:hypothetical protein [Puia sp.]
MIKEIVQEIFPLVEKTAPAIARALGLNAVGGIAPWALYFLSKAFGVRMNEVSQLPSAIINDPESDLKLQHLEESFSEWFIDNTKDMTKNIKISDIEFHLKVSFDPNNATT